MPPDHSVWAGPPGGASLHRSIAAVLRNEIAQGLPPIGGVLPGEHEMCVRFGISRHTVREALRTLAEEGLIERRQGAGTRVVADRARGPYQPSMHSLEELRQYAAETVLRVDVVSLAVETPVEARLLGRMADQRQTWLRVDGVRWAGTEMVCGNRVFVQPRFQPLLTDLVAGATLAISIHEMVTARADLRVAEVEQDIAARAMPVRVARAMRLPTGTPSLLFVRRYLDLTGEMIVWSLNWHESDRFTYRMRLKRMGG